MRHSSLPAALGALALPTLLAAACATDESPPPPARVGAAPAVVTAQPAPPPMTRPLDGGGVEVAEDAGGAPAARSPTAFIYDRVLAKLEDPAAVDLAALERAVEARTGAEVKEIKKGPMGLLSIVFEEASPPRGDAEQRALVERLKGMPELRYAEPEKLLQAR